MKFPKAIDIASKEVISIDISYTINNAIEKMLAHGHRDIVVIDKNNFYILRALDIIDLYNTHIDLHQPLSSLKLIKLPVVDKHTNILQMLSLLDQPTEYICSINNDGSLHGIITHTDITSHIDPQTLMDNYKVNDFLKLIRNVKWVNKNITTKIILQEMFEESLESVIIVEELRPLGILTTKDIVKLIKEEKDLSLPIATYMTTPIETLHKNTSIREALQFIKDKHYKRVIVVDDNNLLLGVVSQKELITLTYMNWSSILKEHQEELHEINIMLQNQNKKYKSLASFDPLTKLYNRYKCEEVFYTTRDNLLNESKPLVLILIDIDHFKTINDTYGHNTGDEVLKQFANILMENTRESDFICRWGGEEFIVLLSNVTQETALRIAEKLRQKIASAHFPIFPKQLTASFGIFSLHKPYTLQESVSQADKALYKAKESGRNCIKSQGS